MSLGDAFLRVVCIRIHARPEAPVVTADSRTYMRRLLWCVLFSMFATSAFSQSQSQSESPSRSTCEANRRRGGEIEEAIVGFQQAGASAAAHTQNFFFDFFISRPVPFGKDPCSDLKASDNDHEDLFGPRTRWWGNVRVASYPQQVSTNVATFITNFQQRVGDLKVNELAQSAEFVTGFEWRFLESPRPLDGNDRDERQLFALSIFGGGGATGPFEPKETLSVFQVPPPTSPQYADFAAKYPNAANAQFVGFVNPDRDRFFRQYSVGLRLMTFYVKKGQRGQSDAPYLAAPAMISASVGQNEVVTGGRFEGAVARFEAFYPLLLSGDRSSRAPIVYLFGAALLRLGSANEATPFILNQTTDPTAIAAAMPNMAVIATPTNRDTYMIGAGIDLTQLLRKPASSVR